MDWGQEDLAQYGHGWSFIRILPPLFHIQFKISSGLSHFWFNLYYNALLFQKAQYLCDFLQHVVADFGDEEGTKTSKSKLTAENKRCKYFQQLGRALGMKNVRKNWKKGSGLMCNHLLREFVFANVLVLCIYLVLSLKENVNWACELCTVAKTNIITCFVLAISFTRLAVSTVS